MRVRCLRRNKFLKGCKGLESAVAARWQIMQNAMAEKLKQIECNGINVFKRIELATKYQRIVPEEFKTNELYEMPPEKAISAVKDKKGGEKYSSSRSRKTRNRCRGS